MNLDILSARQLATSALRGIGVSADGASVTADHLIDAALRGVTFGGLPRILAIAERMHDLGGKVRPITTVRETPISAVVDGGDNVGYVVAHHSTRLAIDKAKKGGLALVGANNTYYTGLFSYYMEMATRENLVAFAVGNAHALVAPEGGTESRIGTNPIAFGFPTPEDPVILDIGTASIMQGELMMHKRLGDILPEGLAFDRSGRPTTDPCEALEGAVKPWGGHRGSGLAIVVQMLAALCDGPHSPTHIRDFGFLVLVIDPKLLIPGGQYPSRIAELAKSIQSSRPLDHTRPVRMPFARSAEKRRQSLHEGYIELPDVVYERLKELADRE
jgi:LDH2 family malate/lactate/ureidoglycolate dehydrogenase